MATVDPIPLVPMPQRVLSAMPDQLLAALFGLITIDPWIDYRFSDTWTGMGWQPLDVHHPAITAILFIEAMFLLPQLTLTDIATRIRKRPPWWLIPPITIGVLLIAPGGMDAVQLLLANQSLLLLPALWSVFHRGRMLWEMPGKPAIERMRARALSVGRANVGAVVVACVLGLPFLNLLYHFSLDWVPSNDTLQMSLASVYFLACGFDAWRVGGLGFIQRQRPFLWFDWLGVRDVNIPI